MEGSSGVSAERPPESLDTNLGSAGVSFPVSQEPGAAPGIVYLCQNQLSAHG